MSKSPELSVAPRFSGEAIRIREALANPDLVKGLAANPELMSSLGQRPELAMALSKPGLAKLALSQPEISAALLKDPQLATVGALGRPLEKPQSGQGHREDSGVGFGVWLNLML